MADTASRNLSIDLALRVGELMLASGAGAADVTATILSVTHHVGLRNCDVDVTFNSLRISHQGRPDEAPVTLMRQVKHREIDYDDLTRVDHLVRNLLTDRLSRDEARTEVFRLVSTGHLYPRWAITAAFGVMGAGVGLLVGGSPIVVGIALLAAVAIDRLQQTMARRRLPAFYQQVAGGLVATMFAVATAATDLPVNPSLVVTASIIMLLAGVGFMGAIQDALTGFYITSGARLLEAVLATAGIIAGVSGGLTFGKALGVDVGRLNPGATGFFDFSLMALGAAITAGAFAFASYAPPRSLAPIAGIGAVAIVITSLVAQQGLGRPWGVGVAALFIGVVSYSVAGRIQVPPLVVVVPAIVPMLPGLSIYRGLSLMSAGETFGILEMVTAAVIAIALASGVILGEYVAQPVRREARRLEGRLSGPRLVGPFRARAPREGQ